jgi:hypothetical protein
MAEQTFGITYDGPALRDGVMPVRELAPSLLSLAETFTAASVIAYPTRKPVSLHIKATDEGSFVVDLIAHSMEVGFDDAVDVFSSNPIAALEGLVFSVVGGQKSLFWLINKTKGQTVKEEKPDPIAPGHVTLTLADESKVAGVPTEVAAFYKSVAVRRHARRVVAPLLEEGVEEIRFEIDTAAGAKIKKEDVPSYEIPAENESVEFDVTQPMSLDVVGPLFEAGRWTFFDGERRFSAPVEDPSFLSQVDAGESFSKGDKLRCDVRVIQTRRSDGKLSIERRIVRVNEHHRASGTQPLPFEGI